jgi:hypothetical protein
MRKRARQQASWRSIARLHAAWTTPGGGRVRSRPEMRTRRVACSMTVRTYIRVPVSVTVSTKSAARMAAAWDGGGGDRDPQNQQLAVDAPVPCVCQTPVLGRDLVFCGWVRPPGGTQALMRTVAVEVPLVGGQHGVGVPFVCRAALGRCTPDVRCRRTVAVSLRQHQATIPRAAALGSRSGRTPQPATPTMKPRTSLRYGSLRTRSTASRVFDAALPRRRG